MAKRDVVALEKSNDRAVHGIKEEQRLQLLIDSVTDYAIYMLEPDGIIASWNSGAQRIKGYGSGEIIGQHFSRFFTEEDRQLGRPAEVLALARSAGRYETAGWRIRKDGSRFWAVVVVQAIRDPQGEIVGFSKVTRDLTERRAAEIALEESERRFRLLVEGITDYALFMLDPNGIVTNWNTGAQRFKGYTAEEIVGQHFSRFYTEGDRQAGLPARALATALREGRYEAEGIRVRKDGSEFWANAVIDPIRDPSGTLVGFAKITRDVTERREAQERLQRAQEQIAQSQKMEALGQLTGGIAHDFNNLLMIVSGHSQTLKARLAHPKDIRSVDAIQMAVDRGANLTRQLLAFSRRQSLNPVVINPARGIAAFREMLSSSVRGNLQLVTDIPETTWALQVDVSEFELALVNIVVNARDAMPDGGTLTIAARNVVLTGEPEVNRLQGEFVAIALTDTGVGIAPELLGKVFEPFFTTKQVGKGTGLGLSQIYGFAQQSGGTVTIASRPGSGTTVTLYLPRSLLPVSEASADEPAQPATQAGSRVLLVEDNPEVADAAAALLDQLGCRVVRADSAPAALQLLQAGEAVDLMFSDIVMPGGMDGVELARIVRRQFPQLPILLTTGYSQSAQAAGSEYIILRKPYEMPSLAKAMSDAIAATAAARPLPR
jgi:PAS domain S-box-containing protein